ncbi:ATP-binding cassette domain-containing protein [Lachnospiraceae bacterium 54-11]
MKRCWIKGILLLFTGILLLTGKTETAYAEGARAYFGTEGGYTWKAGTRSDIGLYLESTEGERIGEVSLTVTYDPDVLEFNSAEDVGVTILSDGEFLLERTGSWEKTFKQILHFTPLVSTHTVVEISAAGGKTPSGEISAETIVRAEVEIPVRDECRLKSILIDGAQIEGFDSGKLFYDISVTGETEKLPVTAEAENGLETEISDTTLSVGDNIVYITSVSSNGMKARYTLRVNRELETGSAGGDINEAGEGRETAGVKAADATTSLGEIADDKKVLGSSSGKVSAGKESNSERITGAAGGEGEPAEGEQDNSELVIKKALRKRQLADTILKVMLILICILSVSEAILLVVRFRRSRLKKEKPLATDRFRKQVRSPELSDRPPIVIQALHVCMDFDRAVNEYSSIKELAIQTIKGQRIKEKYRALNDISFDIRKGSIVGIIGTNGAGKSTLLKIISGALTPTGGIMRVNKNKVQILTLGTGFDVELTGRENVYLNGAIIGYDREFIDEHYEEIVEFAELSDFMNEKVKNYSSGMVSRLGFAIATVGPPPEILILDEVLSVGDQLFQKKSLKKVKELIHGGSTVLMVSHSTKTIKENCDKAIWIEKGHMVAMGDAKEICDRYDKYDGDLERVLIEKGKEMEEEVLEWIG